ncbi:MAG: RND family efflux transporter MFP subunit [Candidatus Magnetoglobus multicellularis str. Araruama]|uniref:RND family efflux transporter MFP subunit n=1 Tax=Candidatus Magnetoglobus multicellularis str. Araruama TaxID=890399 RepID=A0A1V1P6X8_9BACT|nr:MAG: RND family efflux transporter MFP subunit [Candidatus Magnetoglobus multicellularis str. Araruama]
MIKKTNNLTLILLTVITINTFVCESFAEKISPGTTSNEVVVTPPTETIRSKVETIVEWYEAVGTVRPKVETRIEAQITAKVIDVKVTSGSKVVKGTTLVILDNRQLKSRLLQARQGLKSAISNKEQAQHAVAAANAAYTQKKLTFERIKKYFESQAATTQDVERAESAFLQAQASLEKSNKALAGAKSGIMRAKEIVKEAEIALGYTIIKAPQNGEIIRRQIELGDLALPGKPLIILQTEGSLRLEAYVREGLIAEVRKQQVLKVNITTLNQTFDAIVEEIVPYADPQTRTFLVKASLPVVEGLYPGMFGKLLIPAGKRDVIMIPIRAIYRIGQLEMVKLFEKNSWKQIFIQTGIKHGNQIEVLSGISGDDLIGIKE